LRDGGRDEASMKALSLAEQHMYRDKWSGKETSLSCLFQDYNAEVGGHEAGIALNQLVSKAINT
jgi:hypothetical protein